MPPYSLNITKLSYSPATQPISLRLRGCHSLWPSFPRCSSRETGLKAAPHLPALARRDSVCPPLFLFALLTASHLLSFPAGTKIFQFPAYACTTIHGAIGYPGFNVRLATTPGLSQLATAFNAIRAKPSSRWLKNFLSSLLLLKSIAYRQSHAVSWRTSSRRIPCISSKKLALKTTVADYELMAAIKAPGNISQIRFIYV